MPDDTLQSLIQFEFASGDGPDLHSLAGNTIVIFSSDNGTTHLKNEVDYDFFTSVGELRGLKGYLYEGGVRIPAIERWPNKVKASSVSDRNWLPTVLDLIGSKDATRTNIDGISMAPTLLGKDQEPREFLYREFGGYGGQQSIRVADWKAVRQNITKGNLEIELYNLADDVGEQNNVAAKHPDVVAKLKKLMEREHVPSKDFPMKALD